MIKLSGILEYSMGGFLCLRGFASYKMLSAVSKSNPEVQRDLIAQHKGDMASFLNSGEYRFFPEVILSTCLSDGRSDYDILQSFHEALQAGRTWNKRIGGFSFAISQNQTKNTLNGFSTTPMIERLNVTHIKFKEEEVSIFRIDGNHRLSAADYVESDFLVPFCLLLFRNPDENNRFSRAIFYNINAKQIPLKQEENLKVILESETVFTDEKLKEDPSFGWEYYLARRILKMRVIEKYPFVNMLAKGSECTYLVEILQSLIKIERLSKDESSIDRKSVV